MYLLLFINFFVFSVRKVLIYDSYPTLLIYTILLFIPFILLIIFIYYSFKSVYFTQIEFLCYNI